MVGLGVLRLPNVARQSILIDPHTMQRQNPYISKEIGENFTGAVGIEPTTDRLEGGKRILYSQCFQSS